MLTCTGECEQVKVIVHAQERPHKSVSIRVCTYARALKQRTTHGRVGCPWVTLLKRTGNAISSRGITITKTTRRIRSVPGSMCVRTRRRNIHIPGDLRICIPPPATPRSPCTRFLISPLTNPFCAWIAAVMDTVWAHSTDRMCYRATLSLYVLVNYCL